MTSLSAIEVTSLGKDFGAFIALRDVSFQIGAGQVVALLGPNGAGKTTMMRILAGFLAPTHGTARIAGLDATADRVAVASRVGYLPENGPLYTDMTPLALLRFFAAARLVPREQLRTRIDDVVARCELREIIERPIGRLSKGMRQRVGLAQALVHDPDVLVMDEPTAGLDPNQIRRFRHHIEQLRQSKTVLVSTHILQEAEAIADRVLLVHEGRLLFDGTPAEMRAEGTLEESFHRWTHEPC
jgi:ABC-2 type transport system ATP-binding protein